MLFLIYFMTLQQGLSTFFRCDPLLASQTHLCHDTRALFQHVDSSSHNQVDSTL